MLHEKPHASILLEMHLAVLNESYYSGQQFVPGQHFAGSGPISLS